MLNAAADDERCGTSVSQVLHYTKISPKKKKEETRRMSRKCDLLFMRILYILVHLGLLLAFGRLFVSLLWQYELYDDSIRALLYDDRQAGKCTNASLVIDHILTQKHETAKSLLMHVTYITAIFVAMVIMLSRSFALILAYTLFFVAVLGGNLLLPLLTPYYSMALFLASTVLGLTYIVVYLAVPEHPKLPPPPSKRKPLRRDRERGERNNRAVTPCAPPFPVDV